MSDGPKLLVVDDEQVICQACRRIFSPQGFQVEVCTDACEGLNNALKLDYAAILLDIKMPKMDGIQFLEKLRQAKSRVPVLIMTGYPSVPNAAAAIRLGVSDYITKPFTPEEITRAVQRMVTYSQTNGEVQSAPVAAAAPVHAHGTEEFLFFDESWLRLESDGSACVGAVLPGLRGTTVNAVRLPWIGEVVYQGLPLAGVNVADKPLVIVPSPVSGVVAGVNEPLEDDPSALLSDPCGQGWIACIYTTRFEEEVRNCTARRVIVFGADRASAEYQCQELRFLGCRVGIAVGREELAPALRDPDYHVLLIDAASLGETGPELVEQINAQAPSMKVVVAASPEGQWETAYRKQRIFCYAVAPFADNEMANILDAAFRLQEQYPPKVEWQKGQAEPISSISITNRNGHKVHLLAAPGLLRRSEGVGCQIARRLDDRMFPIVIIPGDLNITPAAILKAASDCDRLMVLLAKDCGQLPGSLARDTKAEFASASEVAGKVTTLAVQPDLIGGFTGFDSRTTAALADHIVREMASY